jgi:hypothetical protein
MKAQFVRKGWFYFPSGVAGWIVLLFYCSISVYTLVAIEKNYNSLVSSLIRFFPYFISYSVVYFWIASNTSRDKKE